MCVGSCQISFSFKIKYKLFIRFVNGSNAFNGIFCTKKNNNKIKRANFWALKLKIGPIFLENLQKSLNHFFHFVKLNDWRDSFLTVHYVNKFIYLLMITCLIQQLIALFFADKFVIDYHSRIFTSLLMSIW